jgi:hypothetical protein
MVSGFTAGKTVAKSLMETSEFIMEIFNVFFLNVELGNTEKVFIVPDLW